MLLAVLVTWAGELLNLENGRKVMQDATTMNRRETAKQKIWAGADWNSEAGLWDPLVRTAHHVRDKLNGP